MVEQRQWQTGKRKPHGRTDETTHISSKGQQGSRTTGRRAGAVFGEILDTLFQR